jgi:hypothetical protein
MKITMKNVCFLSLMLCAGAFAQNDTVVRWRGIVGVITAPGIDNPVGQIHSGAGPWTTRSGSATINLNSGEGSFEVEGLVFNGGNASGTPGPVTMVVGTLVCNAGSPNGTVETAVDTPAVSLSSQGNADLSFKINTPATCTNPLFLIRVPSGRWIATGTKSATASKSHY